MIQRAEENLSFFTSNVTKRIDDPCTVWRNLWICDSVRTEEIIDQHWPFAIGLISGGSHRRYTTWPDEEGREGYTLPLGVNFQHEGQGATLACSQK